MASRDAVSEAKSRSGWAIFMGVVTAALGLFLVVYPYVTAALTTVVLGWSLILVGVAQLVFALTSTSVGQFFWKLLSGLVYGGVGVMLAGMPVQGVAALTGALGALLVAQSVLQGIIAFRIRPMDGWGWVLFDAGVALLLGVMILAQWPWSSVWAIGTLVGVSVFMGGVSRIVIAGRIRGLTSRVEEFVQRTA